VLKKRLGVFRVGSPACVAKAESRGEEVLVRLGLIELCMRTVARRCPSRRVVCQAQRVSHAGGLRRCQHSTSWRAVRHKRRLGRPHEAAGSNACPRFGTNDPGRVGIRVDRRAMDARDNAKAAETKTVGSFMDATFSKAIPQDIVDLDNLARPPRAVTAGAETDRTSSPRRRHGGPRRLGRS
jgi:hypothetical protein